jgi:hypothetical protein
VTAAHFGTYAQLVILTGLFGISRELGAARIITTALAAQMSAGACVGLGVVYAVGRDWFGVAFEVALAAGFVWWWWKHRDDDDDDRGRRLRRWVRGKFRRPVVSAPVTEAGR